MDVACRRGRGWTGAVDGAGVWTEPVDGGAGVGVWTGPVDRGDGGGGVDGACRHVDVVRTRD